MTANGMSAGCLHCGSELTSARSLDHRTMRAVVPLAHGNSSHLGIRDK